ncbi:MAG: hypothetical protein HC802_12575 [Caldilineaceae bacterium]|nr:hypothetical protein [Caldilineaceae bacterium]
MKQSSHDFWSNWLVVVSVLNGLMGALFAFTPLGVQALAMMSEWSGLVAAPVTTDENLISFAIGLTGAILVGWSVMLVGLTHFGFRQGERWAWVTIATSLLVWFVVDGYVSASAGLYANIVGTSSFYFFRDPLVATFNSVVRRTDVHLEVAA